MKKPFYDTIILVVASTQSELFGNFKKIWKLYMNKLPEVFKVFFVYGHTDLIPDSYDLIFPEISESIYPGMIQKTIKAMNWIDYNYNYKFLIRTNLSTFWDLYRTHQLLKTFDIYNTLTGTMRSLSGYNKNFISGTDIILSRNYVKLILKHKTLLLNKQLQEDQAISDFFTQDMKIQLQELSPRKQAILEHFETFDKKLILPILNNFIQQNYTHYRLKNIKNRNIDLQIMNLLLENIYNITDIQIQTSA